MRSDTVTRPCARMRQAMAECVTGDDVYDDCPTTKQLQKEIAALFGKEAAIVVASGCQANALAAMVLG